MTILMTGATGYLGSHMLKRLQAEGHQIVVLKRSFSDLRRIENEILDCVSYNLDQIEISDVFAGHSIDVILHCATNYGRKIADPLQTVQANLILPLQLLELGRKAKVQAFINTDTILDKGVNTYSLSKSQFRDWLAEYSTDIACFNVALEHFYGPGDDGSKFVSYIIRSFLENTESIPLTPGFQKRDFIYIQDVVDALATIIERSTKLSVGFYPFQIGTGDPLSIRNFVEMIKELTGNQHTEMRFGDLDYRTNEVMDCKIDISSIQMLGWQPKYSLVQGLKETIKREREEKTQ